jgi:hypothetical protein
VRGPRILWGQPADADTTAVTCTTPGGRQLPLTFGATRADTTGSQWLQLAVIDSGSTSLDCHGGGLTRFFTTAQPSVGEQNDGLPALVFGIIFVPLGVLCLIATRKSTPPQPQTPTPWTVPPR